MISYLLLAAGLLLIFFEFYLPGGIMATGGTLVLMIAFALLFVREASAIEIFLFIAGMIVGLIVVIRTAIWSIKRTDKTFSMYLVSDQEGYHASSFDQAHIGKKGKALSDLRPAGYILLEHKKYSALSVSGLIKKGQTVQVLSGEGDTLKVKSVEETL